MHPSTKKVLHALKKGYESIRKERDELRIRLDLSVATGDFLKRRIKEVHGRGGYVDIVNHTDNPEDGGWIEDREAFINHRK